MTSTRPKTYRDHAMRFGTYMGLYWIIKFSFLPLGFSIPLLQLLFVFFTVFVPVLGYAYALRYRRLYCPDGLPFFRAFSFTFSMYVFATMLTAMAHYIYFRFIDHGFLTASYLSELEKLQSNTSGELAASIEPLTEAIRTIGSMSPLQLTFNLISQNIFYTIFLSILTALLVMKNKKTTL